jgi:hypothetical protein
VWYGITKEGKKFDALRRGSYWEGNEIGTLFQTF